MKNIFKIGLMDKLIVIINYIYRANCYDLFFYFFMMKLAY